MRSFWIQTICFTLLLTLFGAEASAQDCRIVTVMSDQNAKVIVGRSLTIFHAGEAYDLVAGLSEIAIYQPALRQFTIFSENHKLATRIKFEEIEKQLVLLNRHNESAIEYLQRKGDDKALAQAEELRFQMQPKFKEKFDAQRGLLTMSSEIYTYTAKVAPMKREGFVDAYLQYADWTKKLNYLVDPLSICPTPRLKVNQALRNHSVMPLWVELKQPGPGGMHFRSDHEIVSKLMKSDMQYIASWKRLLADPKMQWVEFAEFQNEVRPEPIQAGN